MKRIVILVKGGLQARPFRPCLLLHVILALFDYHGKLRFVYVESQEVLTNQECQILCFVLNKLLERPSQFNSVCEEGVDEVFVPRAIRLLNLHNEGIRKFVLWIRKGLYSLSGIKLVLFPSDPNS